MKVLIYIEGIPIHLNVIKNLPCNSDLSNRAKALRKRGNLAEVIFWKQVHKGKFYGIDSNRQKIIGNYIVDFYVDELALTIEIDGNSHNDKQCYDNRRESFIRSCGIRIWRVSDLRVKMDLSNVMRELGEYIIAEYGR